ncbi:MAG: NrfD/PsrC family molybdoenzyme membrane anchor subunit [Candidatus Omnitrophota bacterium]
MNEIVVTTNKLGTLPDSGLHIWGWPVSLYLFLGGLSAGILLITAIMILGKKEQRYRVAAGRLIVWAPVLLGLGMFFLFLDLDNKRNVLQFYTTFRVTSPMSWGSWVLLIVFPLSVVLILATLRQGYPSVYRWLKNGFDRFTPLPLDRITNFCETHRRAAAWTAVPVSMFLGIYTGILLSAFGARPFWNSPLLGPLFLVSGVSTAAALVIVLSRDPDEIHFFSKIDLALILVECAILGLWIIGMLTSSLPYVTAIQSILGGPLTPVFWGLLVGTGLLLPAFLKVMELRGKPIPVALGASLVLAGGLILRVIMVEAGQMSAWLPY